MTRPLSPHREAIDSFAWMQLVNYGCITRFSAEDARIVRATLVPLALFAGAFGASMPLLIGRADRPADKVVAKVVAPKTESKAFIEPPEPTPEQPEPPPPPPPEPEPEPKPAPEPFRLTGAGQQATKSFPLEGGLAIFRVTSRNPSHLGIWLLDDDGNRVALIANDVGPCDTSKPVAIRLGGKYLLNVQATGAWRVTVEQPRPRQAEAASKLTGTGQRATQFVTLTKGLHRFAMTHTGSGNFAPILLTRDGQRVELLANEIGHFSGSKAVRIVETGIYLINVQADGRWTIAIE